jgi:hypothetical protein
MSAHSETQSCLSSGCAPGPRQPGTLHDDQLQHHADCIRALQRRAVSDVFEIAQHLLAAQQLLAKRGNGAFGDWLDNECLFSRRTAYRCLAAYETFGDCASVAQTFELQSLYLLSGPDVPKAAVADAVKLSKKGEPITPAIARGIIKKHDPTKPAPWTACGAMRHIKDVLRKELRECPADLRSELASVIHENVDGSAWIADQLEKPVEDLVTPAYQAGIAELRRNFESLIDATDSDAALQRLDLLLSGIADCTKAFDFRNGGNSFAAMLFEHACTYAEDGFSEICQNADEAASLLDFCKQALAAEIADGDTYSDIGDAGGTR